MVAPLRLLDAPSRSSSRLRLPQAQPEKTMLKKSNLVIVTFVAAALIAVGCASNTEAEQTASPAQTQEAKPVAFTNDEGKLICPVMGTPIESEEKAVGYADHDGKRYYFCCDGCPEQFKADPAKYAEGASL